MLKKKRRRIAIFGGSFNPIHMGHLWIAQQTLEIDKGKRFDEVWLMPSFDKSYKDKRLVDSKHRFKMCKLAAKKFSNLIVSDIEIKNKFSYTHQTLDYLHQHFWATCYWIVGADWALKLGTWKEAENLKKKVHFVIFQRLYDGSFDDNKKIHEKNTKVSKKNVFVNTRISFQLSSSEIRERIRTKKTITGLVTPEVKQYIGKHKLYASRLK